MADDTGGQAAPIPLKLLTFVPGAGPARPERPGAGPVGTGMLGAGLARPGMLGAGGRIVDISAALGTVLRRAGQPASAEAVAARYGTSLLGVIERAEEALPALRQALRLDAAGELGPGDDGGPRIHYLPEEVHLLAPIPRPLSMRDGYAFRQHVETARRNRGLPMIPEFDQFPVFYYTNHLSVIGPGPVRVRQRHLDKLDFELEAAAVLGKGGRDLDIEQADEAIFGLMVMNDWSARGLQMEEMKLNLGPAKGKDFATALGPYLVPREDLVPFRNKSPRGEHFALGMSAEVNGTPVARGNLADMSWTFAEIIARASYGVDLHPGEVIGSGTVGTGCFLETNGSGTFSNWWLQPGDVVACEVEALGRLENVVVLDEPAARAADRRNR